MADERREVRGTLELSGVVLRLRLGSLPREKLSARDVPLDISWTGTVTDGLSVDYSEVCENLAVFRDREYDYIEELAADVLELLSTEYPHGRWRVTVRKPFPQVGLKVETASFTVEGGENG